MNGSARSNNSLQNGVSCLAPGVCERMKLSVTVYGSAKALKVATYNTRISTQILTQREPMAQLTVFSKTSNGLIRSALGYSNSYTNVGTS